jgi:microcystin-dependent protein
MITPFAGDAIPAGFLLCDGSAVDRVIYSALFSILGEFYGAGDTVNTFNLPDLRGRLPQGRDSGVSEYDTMGQVGGEKDITMDADQVPIHRHILRGESEGDENHSMGTQGPDSSDTNNAGPAGVIWPDESDEGVRENVGSDADEISPNDPHDNMPPFQIVNYIIQT